MPRPNAGRAREALARINRPDGCKSAYGKPNVNRALESRELPKGAQRELRAMRSRAIPIFSRSSTSVRVPVQTITIKQVH